MYQIVMQSRLQQNLREESHGKEGPLMFHRHPLSHCRDSHHPPRNIDRFIYFNTDTSSKLQSIYAYYSSYRVLQILPDIA